ncbi:MAG: hypothetical protein IT304_09015 [Dehalococcoidia bacterium]|nr:hypothetical protein [Dehalococcoidia bacterium]
MSPQKPLQQILLALVLICAITAIAFVGISATTEGDAQPTLVLFVGVMTAVVTPIAALVKTQKTLDVSQQTDQKVDQLLNGSLQGKIASLQTDVAANTIRMSNMERSLVEILARLPPPS